MEEEAEEELTVSNSLPLRMCVFDGFLNANLQLRDTKSQDSKYNLMHFLAISIQEDNKHLDNLEEELPQLALAAKGTTCHSFKF